MGGILDRAEGFRKLERRQVFQEPGVRSREPFQAGDRAGSFDLIYSQRDDFARHLERIKAAGFSHRRVRVVGLPVTPYLQWELHVLQAKDRCGEPIGHYFAREIAPLDPPSADAPSTDPPSTGLS